MTSDFSFLHISDIHYDNKKEIMCSSLVENMLKDINYLNLKHELNIKYILLTGDLVNFGGNSELYKNAYDNILDPLLKGLSLTDKNLIYIPGNHELDRDKVDPDFQKAFFDRISTEGVEKENIAKDNLSKKSQNFFDFIKNFYVWENGDAINNLVVDIEGTKIGFSLYNTSWCSSTYSEQDRKKLQMPIALAEKKCNELEDSYLKIVLMHHPIDWFEDENANAIQHVLSKYNMVLSGHKHLEHNKLEQKGPLKTIYNSAHKLLPLSGKDSGYSIIKVSPNNNRIKIFYREYNDKIGEFSVGITNVDQNKNGEDFSEYLIGILNNDLQICYNIHSAIRKNFIDSLDDLFVTNSLENYRKSFKDLYVDVLLTDYPESSKPYKENTNNDKTKYYTFEEILALKHDINVFGRKESGKTIFANALAKYCLDNFELYKKIPIVIDCKKICMTNSNLKTCIKNFIFDLVDEKFEITKNSIDKLIDGNGIILILDESDILTNKQKKELDVLDLIKIHINDYNLSIFGNDDKKYIENELNDIKTNFYINSYRKNDIRKLINNVSIVEIDNKYVENVINYFDTTSLPRTPFVISLIANICASHKDIIPTNQAKILEQFLENVLEKINPNEQLSRTYDFNNKESFLSCLSHKMYENKLFYMTDIDFRRFCIEYHSERGHSLEDSRFDKIFFDKNILINNDGKIAFRFECFNYYYLAKYAIKNNQFAQILRKYEVNIVNSEILFYYTGLNRDDECLLDSIQNKVNQEVKKNKICEDIFSRDPIKTNLGITQESVVKLIESGNSIDENEKDRITDKGDKSLDYNPYGENDKYNDFESFERLLSVLGFTIKNSEELTFLKKANAFSTYLDGCEILWDNFRKELLSYAKEINKQITENNDIEDIDDELNKAYDIFVDLIRAIIPIAVSQMMFEISATEKMKNIYDDLVNKCDYNTSRKMFLTFLLLDLNIKNSIKYVNDFIKNTKDKNYLYVCLVKLLFNYLYGVAPNNEKLLNPIADCAVKVLKSAKVTKGKIIESLKKKNFADKYLKIDYDDKQ